MEITSQPKTDTPLLCSHCGNPIDYEERIVLHQHNILPDDCVFNLHRECVWAFIASRDSSWSIISPESDTDHWAV